MNLRARFRSVFSGLRQGKAEQSKLAEPSERGAQPAEAKVATSPESRAFLAFANTGEVIQAETLLKQAGLPVTVMAPPLALRTGCDMVLVIPLLYSFRASTVLEKHGLPPLRVSPVGERLLEPLSLFQLRDYGPWLMVRAANMKISIEKDSGRIVNISGGGCPDVPYLAACLIGKNIDDAALIKEHGQTLCGYALHLAAQELLRVSRKEPLCQKT